MPNPPPPVSRQPSRRARARSLLPVPKVLVPAAAGLVAMAASWVATGEFNRLELSQLVLTAGYAAIGWVTPES